MSSPEMRKPIRRLFELRVFELRDQAPAHLSLQDMRDGFDSLWGAYPSQPGVDPVSVDVADVSAAWLVASDAVDNRVIVYLHRGGFQVGAIRSHLVITSRLTGGPKARVLAADYRLAPEHPFPAQIDDTVAVYTRLLGQGYTAERMAFVGDSAGGGLIVSSMLKLRALDLPLPVCAVAISPWTDLVGGTPTRPSIHCPLRPGSTRFRTIWQAPIRIRDLHRRCSPISRIYHRCSFRSPPRTSS